MKAFLRSVGPLDTVAAQRALALHSLPGMDRSDAAAHTRPLRVGQRSVLVTVAVRSDGVDVSAPSLPEGWEALVARWFDLERDISAPNAHLATDALLRDQIASRPGIRPTRTVDAFEAAAMAVIGQQISLAAARTVGGRFVAAYGEPVGEGLRAFPDPGRAAERPVAELRTTLGMNTARAETLQRVAALFASGFDLHEPGSLDALGALRGIGPWTVGYLAIRCVGDADAFPASDIVLRRAVDRMPAVALALRAAAWSPWRSYAAVRLWEMASPAH